MVITINLHSIFRYLVGDENFLSTVIEEKHPESKISKKKNKSGTVSNMIQEYDLLAPYETQSFGHFPPLVKKFITPNFIRVGIKSDIERSSGITNISFIASLNILFRPQTWKAGIDEQTKSIVLLEEMVKHKIRRNFQIDKIKKNTKKIQQINGELVKLLVEGKMSDELIQRIVNIFEINLIIFDLVKMEPLFFWAKGEIYPFLNAFKDIYCMIVVNNTYEPIIPSSNILEIDKKRKIYRNILTNLDEIKSYSNVRIGLPSMMYIDTWDLDIHSYCKIAQLYSAEIRSIEEIIDEHDLD